MLLSLIFQTDNAKKKECKLFNIKIIIKDFLVEINRIQNHLFSLIKYNGI